jgi:U4/U6.U5 tri-snRNP-associated protein 1
MDVDVKPATPNMDVNFVDDDELQAALAQARRKILNKTKILKTEEIAEQRKSLLVISLG